MQALRALAVALVVLYHLWPTTVPGGYVGVDVFFVISGFLITAHLHQEVGRSGWISLSSFYARRARRLLPAAVLVLLATAGAAYVLLPVPRWSSTAEDVLGSALYVQNWVLAHRAVDYSAAGAAASVVQHYWSLSVEEQFYLAWPPLILLLLVVGRRLSGIGRDRLVLAGILAVTGASFAWSVVETAADPAAAYFVTPTRIWELGVGAVLALWAGVRREQPTGAAATQPPAGAVVARWLGVGTVLLFAAVLSSDSAFPGYLAAGPVLGTAAVIAAGDVGRRDPLLVLGGLRPVQFVGDVSYALYLWHWPFILIAPFALGHQLRDLDKLAVLAVCIGLAWLTRVVVETPTQKWRLLGRPRVMAAFTVTAMAVVSTVVLLQTHEAQLRQRAAAAQLASVERHPCFGAAAMAAGAADACAERFSAPASLALVPGDEPWFTDPVCTVTATPIKVVRCHYGSTPPAATIAIVGDSHAEHWRGALHRLARQHNWEIVEMFRGGCPVTSARILSIDGASMDTDGCQDWGRQVNQRLAAERPDAVFTSSWAGAFTYDSTDPVISHERGSRAYAETWATWAGAGSEVFVLRDVPATGGRDVPACLAQHAGDPRACARPRSVAVRPDAATQAVSRVSSSRIHEIDLTDYFCDRSTCYAAIGRAAVYFDYNHMSAQFSRSLAPYLGAAIGGRLP